MSGIITNIESDVFVNTGRNNNESYYDRNLEDILSIKNLNSARQEICTWPGYDPTPLCRLQGLAGAAGVRNILYKDEGGRFGLQSFKALGGAYAVLSLLQDQVEPEIGRRPTSSELADGNLKEYTEKLTVTCATDGNHGKSVAWGASVFGCSCIIYVHENVSHARRRAIEKYGAEVLEVKGTYDDAVRQADIDARRFGRFVVSDTSYEGYTAVPRNVMQGYGIMLDEAYRELKQEDRPTHVFIQGGVGGLAASVCSFLWERFGEDAPFFVVVEPDTADCLLQSARAGRPVVAHGGLDTIMAGLACGEVSLLAWKILQPGADAYMTVTDAAAAEVMRLLATAPYGDAAIVAGESAVAGLAGFLIAAQDPELRGRLHIDENSVVMVVGTEGATDPDLYRQIVGRSAEEVRGSTRSSAEMLP